MAPRPALLQDFVIPEAFADHYGFARRTVRERARAIGACAILGKQMILLPHHCDMLLENAQKCQSESSSAAKSGITGAPLPVGDYAALQAQRTKPSHSGSRPKPKRDHGNIVSMDRGRT